MAADYVAIGGAPMSSPAPAVTKIEARNFKSLRKGETLQGFVELHLPSGLILHDVTVHERAGKRWVGLPARSYVGSDGVAHWQRLVEFSSKEAHARFQKAALSAVDELLGRGGVK
jgi:hypothetical protein